jgi:hypothetical protein
MASPTGYGTIMKQVVGPCCRLKGMCIRILSMFLQEKGPRSAGPLTGSASAAIFVFGIVDALDGGTAMAAIEGRLQTVLLGNTAVSRLARRLGEAYGRAVSCHDLYCIAPVCAPSHLLLSLARTTQSDAQH